MQERTRSPYRGRGKQIILEEVAIEYAKCQTCKQPPGKACVTKRGTYIAYTHLARINAVSGPYWRGYERAELDAKEDTK